MFSRKPATPPAPSERAPPPAPASPAPAPLPVKPEPVDDSPLFSSLTAFREANHVQARDIRGRSGALQGAYSYEDPAQAAAEQAIASQEARAAELAGWGGRQNPMALAHDELSGLSTVGRVAHADFARLATLSTEVAVAQDALDREREKTAAERQKAAISDERCRALTAELAGAKAALERHRYTNWRCLELTAELAVVKKALDSQRAEVRLLRRDRCSGARFADD